MKILTKLALAALVLTSALTAQAQSGSGRYRGSSYVYRNPYAASPSVHVQGYYRSTGTYVAPHYRTAPNYTPTDNLNYRGYGTIRVPRSFNGW
jgi:hypothetical protein